MEPTTPLGEGIPLTPFVKAGTDPQVAAIKQLLKLLDKAAKSARTYGTKNPVAQRFFQQFYDDLTTHLAQHSRLALLVQRNQLLFQNEVVYEPERDATGDSFAFKMYSDGIRELSFHQGLTREDLAFFLEALWGMRADETAPADVAADHEEDDDIVTRLWAKNLETITLVTAEELVRTSGFGPDELELQTQGYMSMPVGSLRELLDRERAVKTAEKEGSCGSAEPTGGNVTGGNAKPNRRFQTNVVGYDVSDEEHEALTQEIQRETARDSTTYILDILSAVLASEPSPVLLSKLFDVWDHVLEGLIRAGQWTLLETVLTMLQEADDELELQTQGYMSMPVGSLRELLDRERAVKTAEKEGSCGSAEPTGGNVTGGNAKPNRRFQTNVVGYDVSDEEHEALTQEIQRETARDSTTYILDILSAVLASEPSPVLLSKLFDVWDHVLEGLIRAGQWTLLETVLTMLQEAETVRPDLSDSHKQQVAGLFDGLGRPERLKAIGVYLNRNPQANTEGLITLLLMMNLEAIPGLCSVLATLDTPAHQAVVMEALQTLARDHAEPIILGLTDKRPTFVRNLLTLISRWNDARFADSVEKTLRHPEATVRREALRILSTLRPSGSGVKLVALLSDTDETVRLTAMKVLTGGQYTAAFSAWSPFVMADDFYDRSPAEKRAIYQALKHTAADEAVPYWQGLLTEWSWTNRKKKEELALLAAEILGKLATPAAMAALELGQKKGGAAVRQACSAALSFASRQHRHPIPNAANS